MAVLVKAAIILALTALAKGNFLLFVRFINYTNPSGLCAECETQIGNDSGQVARALDVTPVCCDEGDKTDNCTTTGPLSCDTRFRWNLRPYGSSLETRPETIPNAANPPYYFMECSLPGSECPFSEVSRTFCEGVTGLLGVDTNPLQVDTAWARVPLNNWTGRVQFYIEAIHLGIPNIIDSFLVDLDDLVLGNPEFTNEATYVGFHNISYMRMSFRVECAPGYCGGDCNTTNPRVGTCATSIVCVNDRLDPGDECNSCFNNLDVETLCNTCVQPNYNPTTNCTTCVSGYDISTSCTLCTMRSMELENNYETCIDAGFDPSTNCEQCLTNRNTSTNCSECLNNRNESTNCTTCDRGWNIATGCTTCQFGRDPSTNCEQCLAGYMDIELQDFCIPITTGPDSGLSVELIGGVLGAVLGCMVVILMLIVLVLIIVIIIGRRGHVTQDICRDEIIEMSPNPVYETNEQDTSDIAMETNALYGVRDNQTTDYYTNEGLGPVRDETRAHEEIQPTTASFEYDYVNNTVSF